MRRCLRYGIAMLVVLLLAGPGFCQVFDFTYHSADYGLPHKQILDLDQDAEGHLWVVPFTSVFIYEFDGQKYIPHRILPNGNEGHLRRVRCGADGKIYLLTRGSFITYDHEVVSNIDMPGTFVFGFENSFVLDGHQNPWMIGKDGRIYTLLDGELREYFELEKVIHSTPVTLFGSEGRVFVVTRAAEIVECTTTPLKAVKLDWMKPLGESVNSFQLDDSLFFASNDSLLIRYDGRKKTSQAIQKRELINKSILKVHEDLAGDLWILAFSPFQKKNLVYYVRRDNILRADGSIGFTSGHVFDMFKDRSGAIWFLTDTDGLLKYTARVPGYTPANTYLTWQNVAFVAGILLVTFALVFVMIRLVSLFKLSRYKMKERIKLEERERLRKQMAMDFHDEMGNKLASMLAYSEVIKSDGSMSLTMGQLDQFQKMVSDVYSGTRDFIWSIDFKSNNLREVLGYIRDYAATFFEKNKISFIVDQEILSDDFDHELKEGSNRQVVLIFKEAMSNIVKHANATQVTFNAVMRANTCVISIRDNGKGFSGENGSGFGLKNIHKRALALDSEVAVRNHEKGGIEVVLILKLK